MLKIGQEVSLSQTKTKIRVFETELPTTWYLEPSMRWKHAS